MFHYFVIIFLISRIRILSKCADSVEVTWIKVGFGFKMNKFFGEWF